MFSQIVYVQTWSLSPIIYEISCSTSKTKYFVSIVVGEIYIENGIYVLTIRWICEANVPRRKKELK